MNKEVYQSPEMEMIAFETEDIIRTSGFDPDDNETDIIPWPWP